MCMFGGGAAEKTADGPVEKGPSDQSAAKRADPMSQAARNPLSRGTATAIGGAAKRRLAGNATLLTAGDVDTSGKKTLLGA